MSNLVDSWLNGIGLGYAVPIFAGQGINSPDMLSELDVVDFPELGISDQNDRKKVGGVGSREKGREDSCVRVCWERTQNDVLLRFSITRGSR